ncbi:hypothetical protein SAMN02745166_01984 [Prosthecobacter debontii]|uniref:Uncharacterized protein n=1 Tax=Prosthecobacter debontii TaxID=48467 RepID=A0A1T4XUW9_9BACT|nr:hypothetical protein [Prosthecobacter debontii]SKA92831.1 hypothetical protein SAMN02745166_01984 [Prosthecobacter debontii]
MMSRYPLELPFRGERSYLHGTDLYQSVVGAVGDDLPQGPFSMMFHSLLRQAPDLICSRESLRQWREDPAFRGELRFGSAENTLHAVLLESDRPVTERKLCNENEVAAAAEVDESAKTAKLLHPRIGVPIEQVVFLNKHLHLKLLPHLSPKWLFARLELESSLPPVCADSLEVVLKQVLGNRFTRSDILLDGKRYGTISFSTPQ